MAGLLDGYAQRRPGLLGDVDPVTALWHNLPDQNGGNVVPRPNVRQMAGELMREWRGEVPSPAVNVVRGFAESPAVIRAYHGSPHRFERFDMSRIGTGEGAQAYGHGLYFAGNEGVARSYREMLARPSIPAEQMAAFRARDPEVAALFERNLQQFGNPLHAYHATDNALPFQTTTHGQRELVYDMREAARTAPATGHMYEVNLNTDPSRLLDWDAPLSQQPAGVRSALERNGLPSGDFRYGLNVQGADINDSFVLNTAKEAADEAARWRAMGDVEVQGPFLREWDMPLTGQAAYRELQDTVRPRMIGAEAERLRSAGIDGIQYLDAGSRAAGQGSRNYVMFDDNLIDIVRRYGFLPLTVGGAGLLSD